MTLEQFINSRKGKFIDKYGKSTNNVQQVEPYGGQCVSLVLDYLATVLGYQRKPYGNAIDYQRLPNSTKVTNPQNGDLVVFPDVASPYGHVGIYYNDQVFDQNPHKAKLTPISNYKGAKIYVRPKDFTNDNSFLYWFETHDSNGKRIKVTVRKKDELITLKGWGFNTNRVIGHEDKYINGDKKQGVIKKGTAIYGRR